MKLQPIGLLVGLLPWLAAMTAGVAQAASLAELESWCGPDDTREQLCSTYLETIIEGLASDDPIMNGGNRMCVPPDADRGQIIRLVRAYAAQTKGANDMSALDGVGAALKGHFPCR
jgi:hypothetical protein